MSGYRPNYGRALTAWLIGILLLIITLVAIAVLLWFKLPVWNPRLVVTHSPFVTPVFRAAGPFLNSDHSQGIDGFFQIRVVSWGSSLVPSIENGLRSQEEAIRRSAMVACLMLISKSSVHPDDKLLRVLRDSLRDESWLNRRSSAYALGKLADKDAVPQVLDQLTMEANADVAIAMCDCLGRLKDPRALPVLDQIQMGRLTNPAQEVLVSHALIACVTIDKKHGLDCLIRALNHPSPGVRVTAVCALGELKDERAIDPLILRLEDPTTWVRRRAALALVAFRSERVVEPILTNMEMLQVDDDPNESLFNNRYFSVDSEELNRSIESLPFTEGQRKRWTEFLKN